MNQIVIRYQDGHTVKGVTDDFFPNRDRFHVAPPEAPFGAKPREILIKDLKAVFFVKDFAGNPAHRKTNEPTPGKPVPGRKVRVVFKDGEVLLGATQGYAPGRPGFFLVPVDAESNNERCFVVAAATQAVTMM